MLNLDFKKKEEERDVLTHRKRQFHLGIKVKTSSKKAGLLFPWKRRYFQMTSRITVGWSWVVCWVFFFNTWPLFLLSPHDTKISQVNVRHSFWKRPDPSFFEMKFIHFKIWIKSSKSSLNYLSISWWIWGAKGKGKAVADVVLTVKERQHFLATPCNTLKKQQTGCQGTRCCLKQLFIRDLGQELKGVGVHPALTAYMKSKKRC